MEIYGDITRIENLEFNDIYQANGEPKDNDELIYFANEHILTTNYQLLKPGQSSSIKGVIFDECTFLGFPNAYKIQELVQNITILALTDCNLTKITRDDLQGLEPLKQLCLNRNNISYLPGNLFELTPNLEIIHLRENEIKKIGEDILEPLKKLKYFDLTENVKINVLYNTFDKDNKLSLQQLKIAIKKCDPNLKWRSQMKKEIRDEITAAKVELKSEVEALKTEIESLKRKNTELEKNCKEQSIEIKRLKLEKIVNNFTVKVSGKDIQTNKEILITSSPVLAKMINDIQDADHIELQEISKGIFEAVLKFMYEKEPPGNAVNLTELFAAAGYLEMKELLDATAHSLMDQCKPENALEILNLCKKYKNEGLRKKAFNELKKTFDDSPIDLSN